MKRIKLSDLVRLPDGTVCTVAEGLANKSLCKRPGWMHQHDQTYGNIFNYPPEWKIDSRYWTSLENSISSLLHKGRPEDWRPKGVRIVRRNMIETPDHKHNWGYISQVVIKTPKQLGDEVAKYGTKQNAEAA